MSVARTLLAFGLVISAAAHAENAQQWKQQQWRQQQQRQQQWQQQGQQQGQQRQQQWQQQRGYQQRRPSSSTMYSETTALDNREKNRFGMFVGVLEPLGTLVSANAAYNFTSFLRAQLGLGYLSALGVTLTTVGGSVKGFVPGWNFSPVAGLGVSYASLSGAFTAGESSTGAFSGSGAKVYGILGADWQARSGFNLGFGAQFTSGPETTTTTGTTTTTTSGGIVVIPYVSLGWFFNWFG